MNPPFLVAVGGVAGALARFLVDDALGGRRGTAVVNVLGSAALGALLAAAPDRQLVLLAGTGFFGAFTTFSSLAVTVVEEAERDRWRTAAGYAGLVLVGALAGAVAGRLVV